MGCAQSRIENEEAVGRCKERRRWMKSAVSARNAFAAAHSAYAVGLKNTGAGLAEFGQGEPYDANLPSSHSSSTGVESSASVAPIQPPSDADLLPPPRPSEFSAASLQLSIRMPDFPNKFPSKIKPETAIREDDEEGEEEAEADDEEEDEEEERGTRLKRRHRATRADAPYEKINTPVPPPATVDHHDDDPVTSEKVVIEPPLPPKVPKKMKQGRNVHHQQAQSASTLDAQRGKIVPATRPSVNLSKILMDLDDHFLKASESTHDVLKMLEATRMHYHSNFADSRVRQEHEDLEPGKKAKEEEPGIILKLEKEIYDLMAEIIAYLQLETKAHGKMPDVCISERDVEIKLLKEELVKEKERGDSEKKRTEVEKKSCLN